MKRDRDELLDHEADGIREFDNDLPRWWLYGFYLTIVFSAIYLVNYHILPTPFFGAPTVIAEYEADVKAAALQAAHRSRGGSPCGARLWRGLLGLRGGGALLAVLPTSPTPAPTPATGTLLRAELGSRLRLTRRLGARGTPLPLVNRRRRPPGERLGKIPAVGGGESLEQAEGVREGRSPDHRETEPLPDVAGRDHALEGQEGLAATLLVATGHPQAEGERTEPLIDAVPDSFTHDALCRSRLSGC